MSYSWLQHISSLEYNLNMLIRPRVIRSNIDMDLKLLTGMNIYFAVNKIRVGYFEPGVNICPKMDEPFPYADFQNHKVFPKLRQFPLVFRWNSI